MRTQHLMLVGLLALAVHGANTKTEPNTNAPAAFQRLKSLVGEWQANNQQKSKVTYELVSGGTALLERETSDTMPVMLTLYHLDGDRLLLTHYCMAGNQPRMLGTFNPDAGTLQFQFLDATNLKPGDGHMHNVSFRFVDNDHFSSEWQFYENGKQKFAEAAQYTRVR